MPQYRVAIADFLNDDLAPERTALGDLADVVAYDAAHEDELVGKIESADAIMLYHNIGLSAKTIDKLTNCKLIIRCGVGFDNVDRPAARAKGIPVANVPDYGTEEVADSAIGLMLALTRGIHLYNHHLQRDAGPWSYTQAKPLYRLRGRTFGIIGLGRIGIAAAQRARALGMIVKYYDPYLPDGVDKALGLTRCETLESLLEQSFVVSPHCPLTPETHHMLNVETIAKMPRGSFLVNTSRGAVVDLACIPDAIASGRLAGAGIDVLPEEPPPADHPLIAAWRNPKHPAHDRLIVNPHAAFYSEEGLMEIRTKASAACRRALLGQPLRNVVN